MFVAVFSQHSALSAQDFLVLFDSAVTHSPRRSRAQRFHSALKNRRAKAKTLWKKLSRKTRRNVAIVLVTAGLLSILILSVWIYRHRGRANDSGLSSITPPAAPVLPAFDEDTLSTDPAVPVRHWRYIVVHHSAGTSGSAQAFDTYHREVRGWKSLGYHFVIGNGSGQSDGKTAPGPRWYAQQAGAHAHSSEHNEFGIGICLVGSFDTQNPSAAQWHTLVELTRRLARQFNIPAANIVGHNQIRQGGSTACPGKNLNMQALREAAMEQ